MNSQSDDLLGGAVDDHVRPFDKIKRLVYRQLINSVPFAMIATRSRRIFLASSRLFQLIFYSVITEICHYFTG